MQLVALGSRVCVAGKMSRLGRTCSWALERHRPNGGDTLVPPKYHADSRGASGGSVAFGALCMVAGWAREQCRLQAGLTELRMASAAGVRGAAAREVVAVAEDGVAIGQAVEGPRVGG